MAGLLGEGSTGKRLNQKEGKTQKGHLKQKAPNIPRALKFNIHGALDVLYDLHAVLPIL